MKDSKRKSSTKPGGGPELPFSKGAAGAGGSAGPVQGGSKRQGSAGAGGRFGGAGPGSAGNSSSGTPMEGPGGTDSANTSRASTPGSDRSFKVGPALDKGSAAKRVQADDEKSTSSREDEVQFQTTPSSSGRRPSSKKARSSSLSSSVPQPVEKSGNKTEEESDQDEKSEADEMYGKASIASKFRILIPEELKYVLVSDWDLITHKKKLFALPAKITIACILSDWVRHVETSAASTPSSSAKTARTNAATEVAAGIRDFFDAFIRKHLLYKAEQRQHQNVMRNEESKAPSEVYGSAHLLRLMVKMGGFLDQFKVAGSESETRLVESTIFDFLKYLEASRGKLFTSKNYVDATDEHVKNEK